MFFLEDTPLFFIFNRLLCKILDILFIGIPNFQYKQKRAYKYTCDATKQETSMGEGFKREQQRFLPFLLVGSQVKIWLLN